jgi:alanyl-tRNA synthetase
MTSAEIRQKFLDFFRARGHVVVPSSSLIPDDPSVLLTTAGMQQFKKYYTGERDPLKDFGSKNTASCQKSFRTSDIDEVGDESHLTFFEMLGNFSFGGYFKEQAIPWAYEFVTKEMGLPISYVSIFKGSQSVPKDEESKKIWQSLGVTDIREQGMEDVFWGPTGTSGPCGPTTEIYCKNGAGKDIEVWNIVFNEFLCSGSREDLIAGKAKLEPLPFKGIDTGMGLERLVMCVQKTKTIFETDLFDFIVSRLSKDLSEEKRRIIADHARGIAFLVSDGVRPSNTGTGYILRRLMRRIIAFAYGENIGSDPNTLLGLIVKRYKDFCDYRNLNSEAAIGVFSEECKRFVETVGPAAKKTKKTFEFYKERGDKLVPPVVVFGAHQSTGVTVDIASDIAKEVGIGIDRGAFEKDLERHKEISRAGQEKKFGGHGLILDTGELKAGNEEELQKVLRLHTATHMLQQALREVLGPEVHQAGSDITPERTRFDFTFSRKLTPEELNAVEEKVNAKVEEDLPMQKVTLPKAEAEKTGALFFFKEKYPDPVNVYFIGRDLQTAWSKEFCGGPHVARTSEVGEFKIKKEEAVGAGVRRIRATVQ